MLPAVHDVVGDAHVVPAPGAEPLRDRLDDAQVGLVRDEARRCRRASTPGPLAAPAARPGASCVVAQRNTAWPSWWRNAVAVGDPMIVCDWSPVAAPGDRADAGLVVGAGPTTAAPAPSAKMIAVERSVRSTQSVSFSAPMTSTLLGGARPDRVGRDGQRVAEAGAGGVEVERAGRGDAEPVRDLRRRRSGWRSASCRSRRSPVDVGRGDRPAVGQRLGAGLDGHVDDRLVLGRRTAARRCRPGSGSTRRWSP